MSAYLLGAGGTSAAASYDNILASESYPVDTPIQGPRGHRVRFKIDSNGTELMGNDNFLDKLGKTMVASDSTTMFGTSVTAVGTTKYVDTVIRVRGMTTGYAIDVPVRFLKVVT